MRHGELLRVGAQQDVDAVDAQDLARGAAHRLQDGLEVQRPADGLVDRGQGPRLLVAEALGLEVPRPLHRQADLAAEGLEEAQLGLVGGTAPGGKENRHVQRAGPRPCC